jgi:hypothetical protein
MEIAVRRLRGSGSGQYQGAKGDEDHCNLDTELLVHRILPQAKKSWILKTPDWKRL